MRNMKTSHKRSGTFQPSLMTPCIVRVLSLSCWKIQIPCFFASLPWDALFLAHQRPLSKTEGYLPPPEASEPKSGGPHHYSSITSFLVLAWEPVWGSRGGMTRAGYLLLWAPFFRAPWGTYRVVPREGAPENKLRAHNPIVLQG